MIPEAFPPMTEEEYNFLIDQLHEETLIGAPEDMPGEDDDGRSDQLQGEIRSKLPADMPKEGRGGTSVSSPDQLHEKMHRSLSSADLLHEEMLRSLSLTDHQLHEEMPTRNMNEEDDDSRRSLSLPDQLLEETLIRVAANMRKEGDQDFRRSLSLPNQLHEEMLRSLSLTDQLHEEMLTRNMIEEGDDSRRIFSLPDQLLEEIFFRASTKTLSQARLVSKRWRKIISDPVFKFLRARRWSPNPEFLLTDIWQSFDGGATLCMPLDTSSTLYPNSLPYNLYLGLPHRNTRVMVMATCSVLAAFLSQPSCAHYDNSLYWDRRCKCSVLFVGNPNTKTYVALPFIRSLSYSSICGLACDVSSTSFKLVILERGSTFSVISSVDLKWRRVESSSSDVAALMDFGPSVYCDGKLHWLATPGRRVLVFDVATEEASVIHHPAPLKPLGLGEQCLGRSDDHLCLVALEEGCIRIWALVDYSRRGVWTFERQILTPCTPLEPVLYDGVKCVLLVLEEEEGGGSRDLLCKMVVQRLNGSSAAQWEDPWPTQCDWNRCKRYLPYCSTMM